MAIFTREEMTPQMRRTANGLFFCVASLVCFGLLMMFSISAARSSASNHELLISLGRRIGIVGLSVVAMMIASYLDLSRLEKYRFIMIGGAVVLLALVLAPKVGQEIYGARRWIRLGAVGIQPSEIVKVLLLLFLAGYIKVNLDSIDKLFGGLVIPGIYIGAVCGLIFLQPDYSTAILIGGVSLGVLVISGSSFFWVGSSGLAALPLIGFMVYNSPARMRRITAFMNPEMHSSDAGYQTLQSLIALGSGGIFGVGGGAGAQKLHYLPEVDTDFVYAVIGEEFGLVGAGSVIILFALIAWFGFKIARSARDTYASVVAAGATLFIAGQALIHIAVVTGAAPITGIPLPFVSQGGSSLVACMVMAGLIVAAARRASMEQILFGTESGEEGVGQTFDYADKNDESEE